MIANILQPAVFESAAKGDCPRIGLGVLPLSHGYGLVTTHAMFRRGDTTVIHSSFNMQLVLKSVQDYRIERLYLVSAGRSVRHLARVRINQGSRCHLWLLRSQQTLFSSRYMIFRL
jgi:hypothetical protein